MMPGDWPYHAPPDLAAFETLAREAFDDMPEGFRALCGNVVMHVAEEAEREMLRSMGMSDPLELSGLFEGVGLPDIGVSHPYPLSEPHPPLPPRHPRRVAREWKRHAERAGDPCAGP